MKLSNTIYQSDDFNTARKKVIIDGNDIFYSFVGNGISVQSSLVPMEEYSPTLFKYFFIRFPNVKYLKFERAVYTGQRHAEKIIAVKHVDSNFRLALPNSIEMYKASLGRKTRMHLGQYQRYIERELNNRGGGYHVAPLSSETRDVLNAIVDLNHRRCEAKGFTAGTDEQKLFDTLKSYGVLNWLTIGDEIVAGTIGSIYNNQFCLHVIAHSDAYGKMNPGNVILYKTIDYAIARQIPIFNFLWGNCEYKTRFGAKEVLLYDCYLYRRNSDFIYNKMKQDFKRFSIRVKNGLKSILRPPYHAARWLYHHTLKRPPVPLGYIFMLHRVDEFEDGHLWCNEHMKVTPAFLDEQLSLLKQKYDIIPLAEVPARLRKPQKRKFIVFTMDDGYKDNFTNALPVFKKHSAPYTIFVTTDFPDKTAVLWWYELEDLLLSHESLTLSNGVTYPARTYEEKCDSFLKIREEILKLNQLDLENELNKLFAGFEVDWTGQCEKLCLSWDDICSLGKEPLVTIGAHTKHHYNLKQLETKEEVIAEIKDGCDLLKKNAGIMPTVFAYPFGSPREAGEREYAVLSELPFECACIAYGGECTKQSAKNLSALPRIMFKQDFRAEDLLR